MFQAGAVFPLSPALVQLLTVPRDDFNPVSDVREVDEPPVRAGLMGLADGTANEGFVARGLGEMTGLGRRCGAVGPVVDGLKVAVLLGPMVSGKLVGLTR